MKTFLLFCCLACGALGAGPVLVEELSFHYAPSFVDGVRVRVARLSDGAIQWSSYSISVDPKKPVPTQISRGVVTKDEFEALRRKVESSDLRLAAESDQGVYLDGEVWIFEHTLGRRTLKLEFYSPPPSSSAHKLGQMFYRLAKLQRQLPR